MASMMEKLTSYQQLFPKPHRRRIASLFTFIARSYKDVDELIEWAKHHIEFELAVSVALDHHDVPVLRNVFSTFDHYPEQVRGMAEWALWWVSLSQDERDLYRQPHANEEPTEEQQAALLLYGVPVPKTRVEAEILIRSVKGGIAQEVKKSRWKKR